MRRFPDLLLGFLLGLASLLVVFLLTSDFAAHYEICENAHAGAKECASYNVLSYTLHKIGAALDSYNGAITAIATAFIAWFTLALRRSTDRLWDAGERQIGLLRESGESQSRDMQASLAIAGQSAIAASKSAEAAEKTVNIVDANTQRNIISTRAYVFLSGWETHVQQVEGRNQVIGHRARWTNFGSTPARNVGFVLATTTTLHGKEVVFRGDTTPATTSGAIGSGDSRTSGMVFRHIDELMRVWKGEIRLFALSIVYYTDVFDPSSRHTETACVEVEIRADPSTLLIEQGKPTDAIQMKQFDNYRIEPI